MSLASVAATELSAQPGRFDSLIDVRSPAEFAEDHVPGAVNWPVLDDDERRIVGTLYKQVSPLQARTWTHTWRTSRASGGRWSTAGAAVSARARSAGSWDRSASAPRS